MRTAICTVFMICGLAASAGAQQNPPAAIPVGVVKAEHKSIEKTLDFVGRVEAVNRVEIRARVQGFLEAVLFKEGDPIKEGDPLYRIEKGLFQAAVEQADGALTRSKASKVLTEVQLAAGGGPADKGCRHAGRAGSGVCRGRAGERSDPERRGQPADRQNQSWLYRNRRPGFRTDRPHQHHQGQCCRSRKWPAHRRRQPGSDVCDVSGEPARFSAGAGGRSPGRRQVRSRPDFVLPTAGPTTKPAKSISST